jgi:hypothetical protein
MSKLKFRDMPWSIKLVTGVAWMAAWVTFEETVVDRSWLWHYMPFYKVGDYCVWDATAATVIVVCLYFFGRASPERLAQ